MISDASYSPLHPKSAQALKRLRHFHEVVADHSHRNFPSLVINDGAVVYRDLSLRHRSNTHDFLNRSWNLFESIRRVEHADGHPGARMVLAVGYRMRGRRAGMDTSAGHFKSLMDRFSRGEIDANRAIREAATIRPRFDIVPQLQANFAFTKAYVAESSGSKGGLPGPCFYVDTVLFKGRPEWLELGTDILWENKRLALSATFAELKGMPNVLNPEAGPNDIRDGLEIAQELEGDPAVLTALQKAAKT